MNVIISKNSRNFGSDGELIKELTSNGDWKVIALTDALSPLVVEWDRFLYRDKIKKNNGIGRVLTNIKLVFRLLSFRFEYGSPHLVVCGSAELALLSQFFLGGKRKFYLFSDITGFHKSKYFSWLVKMVENYCFKKNWIPCVTSPGFVWGYLRFFPNFKKSYLVYNCESGMPIIQGKNAKSEVSQIVWCGLLRCRHSAELLNSLLQTGKFKLLLAGSSDCINLEEMADNDNVRFFGRYGTEDLKNIYAAADYVWCCDWELGVNSNLLLPNRLFQAIKAGRPVICSKGSWVERVVNYYRIGIVIDGSFKDVAEKLNSVSDQIYSEFVANLRIIQSSFPLDSPGWSRIINADVDPIDLKKSEQGFIF